MALVLFAATALSSCKNMPDFSDVTGKEWFLAEIRTKSEIIVLARNDPEKGGLGNAFSLVLDAGRVSGAGAPNRYFAPYTLGENQAITIQDIAGTMMAPLFEPEKLKEHDYFSYLQNASKWDFAKRQLKIYTRGDNGAEAVMIFSAR